MNIVGALLSCSPSDLVSLAIACKQKLHHETTRLELKQLVLVSSRQTFVPPDTVRELKQLNFFFSPIHQSAFFYIHGINTFCQGRGLVVPQQALKKKWDILGCVPIESRQPE